RAVALHELRREAPAPVVVEERDGVGPEARLLPDLARGRPVRSRDELPGADEGFGQRLRLAFGVGGHRCSLQATAARGSGCSGTRPASPPTPSRGIPCAERRPSPRTPPRR